MNERDEEDAKILARIVDHTNELNSALADAARNGLRVEVAVEEGHTFNMHEAKKWVTTHVYRRLTNND